MPGKISHLVPMQRFDSIMVRRTLSMTKPSNTDYYSATSAKLPPQTTTLAAKSSLNDSIRDDPPPFSASSSYRPIHTSTSINSLKPSAQGQNSSNDPENLLSHARLETMLSRFRQDPELTPIRLDIKRSSVWWSSRDVSIYFLSFSVLDFTLFNKNKTCRILFLVSLVSIRFQRSRDNNNENLGHMEQNNKNTRSDSREKYTRTRITRSLRRRRSLHRKSDNFFSWSLHVVFEPRRREDEQRGRESVNSIYLLDKNWWVRKNRNFILIALLEREWWGVIEVRQSRSTYQSRFGTFDGFLRGRFLRRTVGLFLRLEWRMKEVRINQTGRERHTGGFFGFSAFGEVSALTVGFFSAGV